VQAWWPFQTLNMRRAYARIHVEYDASRRAAAVHKVDPATGKITERAKVPFRREPACLEAAHLAWRGRKALRCLAADDPAHCRIVAQPFSIVHVFISGETTKH
jgi:hypothetical protein